MDNLRSASLLHRSGNVLGQIGLVLAFALWAAIIVTLARMGLFQTDGGPPLPFAPAVLGPSFLFLLAYVSLRPVRAWVGRLDLAQVIGIQTWRVMGASFLILWAMGFLPTTFAITAGIGDLAVGVLAIPTSLAVARRAPGWQVCARRLMLFGIADFVVVFSLAALSGRGMPLHYAGQPLPTVMQDLPMVLIPALAVPLALLAHVIALLKLRETS